MPRLTEELRELFAQSEELLALKLQEKTDIEQQYSEDIKRYRLKEVWFFDSRTSTLGVRILGIAPLKEEYDDNGNFKYERPLFWAYYPQCRELLARQARATGWVATLEENTLRGGFGSAVAVTGHELGHNWGAPHCSSSACYLMCGGCHQVGHVAGHRAGKLLNHKENADIAVDLAEKDGQKVDKVLVWQRYPGKASSATPMVEGRD